MRIGHGYDAHKLISGNGLVLGGVLIKSNYEIEAHSDGDIVIHALIDALLGAACLGDIGKLFPSVKDKYKDISSRSLLKEVNNKLIEKNYSVKNIDITYVGQEPKLLPHISEIRKNLSSDLNIEIDAVSCKATSTDGLGFEGAKKGVSCYAVVLISK